VDYDPQRIKEANETVKSKAGVQGTIE
jgi:hypothetical protein